jgi:ABC-type Mn2+/Zn2+ transport system ATPase subunit
VADKFDLLHFLPRQFARLSEGEKTRVLLCRAFLAPAPVYLIDEGFMALSGRYFDLVTQYLNALAPEAVVVIAANERISALHARLEFPLRRWHMERGRLTILA